VQSVVKFICLLQVGAICLQYSHDDVPFWTVTSIQAEVSNKLGELGYIVYCKTQIVVSANYLVTTVA